MTADQRTGNLIQLFGEPGCSGCLRMKEFVEKTGLPFDWINVDESAADRRLLADLGIKVPAACVDSQFANGIDLAAIADLIGAAYEAPTILPPAVLMSKYELVNTALCRYVGQLPENRLQFSLPGRDRPVIRLATHAASVMRAFFSVYYEGVEDLSAYREQPESIVTTGDIINRAVETREQLAKWWELDGILDPLEAVVQTHFGFRTTLEILEREVWHTAQHTRQVMFVLEILGISPISPLTEEDLAGLPLPEGVHD